MIHHFGLIIILLVLYIRPVTQVAGGFNTSLGSDRYLWQLLDSITLGHCCKIFSKHGFKFGHTSGLKTQIYHSGSSSSRCDSKQSKYWLNGARFITNSRVWSFRALSFLSSSQKLLQLFHGITLDGQIKIPSLNGSSTQKRRLDDKRGEHRRENSWVHTAANSCLVFFPLFLRLLLFSLEE